MNSFFIHWAALENRVYLPLLLLFALLLAYQLWRMARAVAILAPTQRARKNLVNYSFVSQLLNRIFVFCGIVFLFLALLRPQWEKKEETFEHHGRDVLIALDISRSMLCDDMSPNRLAAAKKKIVSLVKKLSVERVGLLLFAGSPFLICPLTTDYESFFMFLNTVDAQTISSGGTAIDAAIQAAIAMYNEMPERKHKVLVLFTDGEDYSNSMDLIKQEADRVGMHIFAFGLGTKEGAPVPLLNDRGVVVGHQKDKQGKVVISRLDEALLEQLVNNSGGTYIHAMHNESDIAQLSQLLQKFEKEKIEEKKKQMYQDKYHYSVAISLLFFLLAWLL